MSDQPERPATADQDTSPIFFYVFVGTLIVVLLLGIVYFIFM